MGRYPLYEAPSIPSLAAFADWCANAYGDDAAFVRSDGAIVTFAQLNDAVSVVAQKLAPLTGQAIGLQVSDPCLAAIAYFAAAQAECSVALLAPTQPMAPALERRRLLWLKDADIASLVRKSTLTGALAPRGIAAHDATEVCATIAQSKDTSTEAHDSAGIPAACTIMQSSGTTGAPKAVVLTNEGILTDMCAGLRTYTFKRSWRYVSLIPVTHAFGLTCDLLAPLAVGATIGIPSSRQAFLTELASFAPTALNVPPAVAEALATFARIHGDPEALARLTGGNLRKMLCGGAHLSPSTTQELRACGIEAFGCYGLTECSPCVAVNRDKWHKDGSCGVVLDCCEVAISSDGEILVRGANVMRGYLDEPDTTVQVVRDGWLHTGDLGQLDDDGFLWTQGRLDDLIVLADGTKVAPEPIEEALLACPAIEGALVFADRATASDLQARLYVPDVEQRSQAEAFTRALEIDGAHRIAQVTFVDRPLARTATGKLVRHHDSDQR